jgi:RimJ/RimL family protein N-acetyltransferase
VSAARPTDPLRTPRLELTPVRAADVDDLSLLHGDPLVAFWTGPWNRSSIRAWADAMADRWVRDGVGKWMARRRTSGTLVGRGGFTRIELEGEDVLELGWAVRDALTGRGYASEIGRAALRWAEEFMPGVPVVAFTEVHNAASRAVMSRIGMHEAGVIHREGLVEGHPDLCPDAPFALYRHVSG